MPIKNKLILAYFIGLPSGIMLFCLLFYFNVLDEYKIIFYRGLLLIGIVCVIQIFLLSLFLYSSKKSAGVSGLPHAISIAMVCLSINMAFFIVVPVSLDRSVSVFLLGYMSEKGSPATKQELEKAFNDIYVLRYGAIERRIDEQIASGNLVETSPGLYALSDSGISFIRFSRFIANVFNIDTKFVKPDVKND